MGLADQIFILNIFKKKSKQLQNLFLQFRLQITYSSLLDFLLFQLDYTDFFELGTHFSSISLNVFHIFVLGSNSFNFIE